MANVFLRFCIVQGDLVLLRCDLDGRPEVRFRNVVKPWLRLLHE